MVLVLAVVAAAGLLGILVSLLVLAVLEVAAMVAAEILLHQQPELLILVAVVEVADLIRLALEEQAALELL
jgi:hypothetical protein